MNTTLLNRFQLELAMLHHIYLCTDEAELAVLFEKVTGHKLQEWDRIANAWQCDVPFERLVSADVGTALDFLNDYWKRHKTMKNYLTRPQIALVLIGHVFEELDEYDVAELFQKATGHKIEPADFNEDIGDAWECEVPFETLADSSLPKILEWLADAMKEAHLPD